MIHFICWLGNDSCWRLAYVLNHGCYCSTHASVGIMSKVPHYLQSRLGCEPAHFVQCQANGIFHDWSCEKQWWLFIPDMFFTLVSHSIKHFIKHLDWKTRFPISGGVPLGKISSFDQRGNKAQQPSSGYAHWPYLPKLDSEFAPKPTLTPKKH